MTDLLPEVASAVDAVRAHFAGKPVEVVPDGADGAFVLIHGCGCRKPHPSWSRPS